MKKTKKLHDYEAFVDKFKPKLTTDDCYTPDYIYDEVIGWLGTQCDLSGREIVRPFWPGGDYTAVDYPKGCVVVDNPPFSILAKIRRWYMDRGIHYFLFAPHLTALSPIPDTVVVVYADVTYHNGAVVRTSFVSNLPCFAEFRMVGAPQLYRALTDAQELVFSLTKKKLPTYIYPENVVSISRLALLVKAGLSVSVPADESVFCRSIASMKRIGKSFYGGSLLCSDRVSAEIKAAEIKAAEMKNVYRLVLSPEEQAVVKSLNVGGC